MTRRLIPVACTLEGDDLRERAGEWATLIDKHGTARRDLTDGIELRFDDGAADALARLVAAEQSCCAWADWSVRRDGDTAVLTATSSDADGVATLRGFFVTAL